MRVVSALEQEPQRRSKWAQVRRREEGSARDKVSFRSQRNTQRSCFVSRWPCQTPRSQRQGTAEMSLGIPGHVC